MIDAPAVGPPGIADASGPAERRARVWAEVACAIALLAAAGWLTGARFLAGQWGAAIPMAPSTALAIILLSGGVLCRARWPGRRASNYAALALAVASAWLGALAVAGFEWPGRIPPARMSPFTAGAILLESGALALLLGGSRWRLADCWAAVLALAPATMNLLVLAGYLYGSPLSYSGASIPVELPTALALALLGLGQIQLALPGVPGWGAWSGDSMRGVLLRAFLPAMLLILILDGWLDVMQPKVAPGYPALWQSATVLLACLVVWAVTSWTARRTGAAIERAKEALERNQRLLAATERMGEVGGWEIDVDTQEAAWTEGVYDIHELDASFHPTLSTGLAFYPPESRLVIERAVRRAIEHGEPFDLEVRIVSAKGNPRWVHVIGSADPERRKVFGFFQNVTGRRQAEEALREKDQLIREVIDCAQEGVVVYGRDLRYEIWNPFMEQLTGIPAAEALGRHPLDLFPFLRDNGVIGSIEQALAGETPGSIDLPYVFPDGSSGWTSHISSPLRDAKGEIVGAIATVRNITARRRVEEELARSQAEMKAIYDHAPVMMCVLDADRRVLYANPAFTAFTETSEEDLTSGRACGVFGCVNAMEDPRGCGFGADCRDCALRVALEDTLQTGIGRRNIEHRGTLRRGGERREVVLLGSTALIRAAGRTQLLLCLQDITERKRAEEALLEREEQYRMLVEHLPAGVVVHGPGTEVLLSNSMASAILGLSEEQMLGKPAADPAWRLLREDGTPLPREEYPVSRVVASGRAVSNLVVGILRPDRPEPVWGLCNAFPERDLGGKLGQVVVTFIDITERKRAEDEKARLEAQLRQAQKMESVGRLAGGVAHEFNNLLTVINGYAAFLAGQLGAGDPLKDYALEIGRAGENAASLTAQLLAFGRKQVIRPRALSLNGIVREADRMLRRLIGDDIELRTRLDPRAGQVFADPDQMHHVIVSLAANARDAMPHGGTLEIATGEVEIDEAAAAANPDASPGRHALLTIADTGVGMAPEVLQALFEPFFTTKGQGKGTGLGLATVYGIVRQSNGWIDVHSEVGRGSSFRIYLPRLAAPSAEERARPALRDGQRGDETVLVVEDQDAVRRLTTAILKKRGYRVLEAGSGADACAVASGHAGDIDLLLTDVIMPGMNGRALAEQLRESRPGLRAAFMSGYSAEMIADRGLLPPGVTYIQKPFSPEELAAKVREALSAPPAS